MSNLVLDDRTVTAQLAPVIRRLNAVSPLSSGDIDALTDALTSTRRQSAQSMIVAEGAPGPALFLLSGLVSRERHLNDGRRQIVSFVLPGDTLYSLRRPTLATACGATALSPVVMVDADPLLRTANDGGPAASTLSRALCLADRLDELLLRDQIVRLGVQTAYERMAHLFLELFIRMQTVGLARYHKFEMPLTQEMLANALGLSVVHVNRTLQQVRRDKLLEFRGGIVTILDEEKLKVVASWSPLPSDDAQAA